MGWLHEGESTASQTNQFRKTGDSSPLLTDARRKKPSLGEGRTPVLHSMCYHYIDFSSPLCPSKHLYSTKQRPPSPPGHSKSGALLRRPNSEASGCQHFSVAFSSEGGYWQTGRGIAGTLGSHLKCGIGHSHGGAGLIFFLLIWEESLKISKMAQCYDGKTLHPRIWWWWLGWQQEFLIKLTKFQGGMIQMGVSKNIHYECPCKTKLPALQILTFTLIFRKFWHVITTML